MYFAESTMGFYDPEIHGDNIPADAVTLTDVEYQECMQNLVTGKVLGATDGRPTFTDYVVNDADIRAKRDALLRETDWWGVSDRTMTAEEATYRQALRDVTTQAGFPTNVIWPTKP